MDSLRGNFDAPDFIDAPNDLDFADEDSTRDLPPAAIGQDERRMQVRAYNHWASMLGERNFPSIEELDPMNLPDFGPFSVLLDFSTGIENPAIQYLGEELAIECGAAGSIVRLSDIPSRSLLSRITDHYLQILANQAPIGFEAEFVNQRGATILYRGILLPFSSDDETIDFIYGVINWKEIADQAAADELLLEIDQALEADEDVPVKRAIDPVTEWADGPSADAGDIAASFDHAGKISEIGVAGLALGDDGADDSFALPEPDFSDYALFDDDDEGADDEANYDFASLTDHIAPPAKKAMSLDLDELASMPSVHVGANDVSFGAGAFGGYRQLPDWEASDADDESVPMAELPDDAGLYDYLAAARQAADTAVSSEDRSRHTLYAAIGRAYDFSLAALEAPETYSELLEECGIAAQDRAPMTPVVKLVFGADYDKTRVTEYAAALSYAHRVGIARNGLAGFLAEAEGGLKGVVNAERRWRREQAGKDVAPEGEVREALASKLREIAPQGFADIPLEGSEFALVMIRRTEAGEIAVLGEIERDIALIERAARKLLG